MSEEYICKKKEYYHLYDKEGNKICSYSLKSYKIFGNKKGFKKLINYVKQKGDYK